jgi:Flp pilus assembly pilin Flp
MVDPTEQLRVRESGATAIEYALVASVIAVAVLIAMNTMAISLASKLGGVNFESGYAFEVSEPK